MPLGNVTAPQPLRWRPSTISSTPPPTTDTPSRLQPTSTQEHFMAGWTALHQHETRKARYPL
eukprot:3732699-Prorocentrum_lima.AAC.1